MKERIVKLVERVDNEEVLRLILAYVSALVPGCENDEKGDSEGNDTGRND